MCQLSHIDRRHESSWDVQSLLRNIISQLPGYSVNVDIKLCNKAPFTFFLLPSLPLPCCLLAFSQSNTYIYLYMYIHFIFNVHNNIVNILSYYRMFELLS
uniref:Uncharacterized protein n=1 Tax=Physcomitrium patens TaxID=3218 RepID=A0A2K1KL00_PHYPA|nr:hypothetical protein PHYPA_008135 [Physcomitrium patens]